METFEQEFIEALTTWLLAPDPDEPGCAAFMRGLGERLSAAGIPLTRMSTGFLTSHPEVMVLGALWTPESGVSLNPVEHGAFNNSLYADSPIRRVRETRRPYRARILPEESREYEILNDLAAVGATDYLALPLISTRGVCGFISMSTHAPGGFSEAQVAALERLGPLIAMRVEIESAYLATDSLLEVYLGSNAARQVRAGRFRRGSGELIRCALWYADMRGFTNLGGLLSAPELVRLLDRYFERVADPIAKHGGEVLKLIGDAVLAIFPVGETGDPDACAGALAAAHDAREGLTALNAELAAEGAPEVDMGVALHLGEVIYGNVGGSERLDFTVIGASVNEVSRMEGLCKQLEEPLILSGVFAEALGRGGSVAAESLRPLGSFALRGVTGERALFGPRAGPSRSPLVEERDASSAAATDGATTGPTLKNRPLGGEAS